MASMLGMMLAGGVLGFDAPGLGTDCACALVAMSGCLSTSLSFPSHLRRALDQAARFEDDISLPTAVLFFDCPEEEMEKRLLKRGETSGRTDDNAGRARSFCRFL